MTIWSILKELGLPRTLQLSPGTSVTLPWAQPTRFSSPPPWKLFSVRGAASSGHWINVFSHWNKITIWLMIVRRNYVHWTVTKVCLDPLVLGEIPVLLVAEEAPDELGKLPHRPPLPDVVPRAAVSLPFTPAVIYGSRDESFSSSYFSRAFNLWLPQLKGTDIIKLIFLANYSVNVSDFAEIIL